MFGLGINKLGSSRSQASATPETLFYAGEEGTFLDFTTSQVYADTAGTDPAEVGEGIAFIDDKSPNDTDSTQATSTARPIFARVPVGGRRNLLTYTEDFSNAVWVKGNTAVLSQDATGPDGDLSATTLVDSGAGGSGFVSVTQAVTITANTPYVFSTFLAKDQLSWCQLRADSFDAAVRVNINLLTGEIGTDTAASSSIESAGDFYRCSFTFQSTTDLSGNISIYIASANDNRLVSLDGTSSILIYGAQLEVAS